MGKNPIFRAQAICAVLALSAGCAGSGAAQGTGQTGPTAPPAVVATPAVAATTPAPAPTRVAPSPAAQRDVTYCRPGGTPVKMDIYQPPSSGKATPAVVYIHGGAWMQGDKAAGVWLGPLVNLLVGQGYLVAAINYRLAPANRWPAQIEDAKCAVRFLRASAPTYNLDPGSIAAVGFSAGGQLAALLGTTEASAGLEGDGGYPDQSSRVQAVVDISGPADLTRPDFSESQRGVARQVFGATSADDPVLRVASPVTYISKGDPPFLIVQGDKDKTVPPSQSRELNDRLKAAGVESTLILVSNAGHSYSPVGGQMSPSRDEIAVSLLDFLNRHLKQRG